MRGEHRVHLVAQGGITSAGPIEKRLESYEELGRNLEIRTGQGMVINGPSGTVTLQEGPSLAEVEAAIAEVE